MVKRKEMVTVHHCLDCNEQAIYAFPFVCICKYNCGKQWKTKHNSGVHVHICDKNKKHEGAHKCGLCMRTFTKSKR